MSIFHVLNVFEVIQKAGMHYYHRYYFLSFTDGNLCDVKKICIIELAVQTFGMGLTCTFVMQDNAKRSRFFN